MKPKRLQIKYPLVCTARGPGAFAPNQNQLQKADEFFNKCNSRLSFMIFNEDQLKSSGTKPEVMVLGRSNVGKSSLITALLYPHGKDKPLAKKEFARTSKRPGFTKSLNFYNCGDRLHLVDSPGYGHKSTMDMGHLVTQYLKSQRNLRRVYLLVDGYVGITRKDQLMMEMINEFGVPWQIVLTKIDKHIKKPVDYNKLYRSCSDRDCPPIAGLSESDAHKINNTIESSLVKVENLVQKGYGTLIEEIIGTNSNITLNYLGIRELRASILQACSFKGFV